MSSNVELMVGNRPISSLRVVDLKQELEKRGLSKSGTKKDLVERLRLHLQIEKHRDTGASADEEELPNYSQVHDELADQNPFIRDYLASQAELFHSQKVVKKLVEEEAKRESETSADEGVADSHIENSVPMPVLRSSPARTRRTPKKDLLEVPIPPTKVLEPEPKDEPEMKSETISAQVDEKKDVEEPVSPSKDDGRNGEEDEKRSEADENEEDLRGKESPTIETPSKIPRSRSSSPSRSPVREKSPEKEAIEVPSKEPEAKDEPEKKPETISIQADEKKDVDESPSPKPDDDRDDIRNGKVDEKISEADGKEEEMRGKESPTTERSSKTPRSRSSSPSRSPVREKSPEKVLEVPSKEPEPRDEPEQKTETVAVVQADEKKDVDESSSPRSDDSKDDSRSAGEDEKRSEADENEEELRGKESPTTETSSKTPRSRSSSASRSPVREKSPEKEMETSRSEEPDTKDEPEEKSDSKSAQAEEKMDVDESSSPRYKSSQKETSYTNNDIAGEEALDYGEEEDDEDRNESDPQEFSWARRSLRFKIKSAFTAPICKWKLEEESKHLVVKSELLNSYYDDIKLVPLEQLKLEEKSSEAAADTKREIERKPSISKEVESVDPLPTRTVENVAPTIKRTVSIIPSTKIPTDDTEETDKALTPPRNPPSDVLLITNLVRPFTLIQLKEMLQRTGNLQDIWVDKIKSKCIAKFGSQEEAFETRAALHGVCWPNSNPKSLHVDYTTQDNLDEHKVKEGAELSSGTEKPVSAQPVPVREWDVGKKAEPKSPGRNRKRSRSRSTSRDRTKRSRRSPSPGRRRRSKSPAHERRSRGGEGKEPEPMGKALDELFRKTIATPSIYWLPLTPEQIAEKEELRRKRMLERERRLAELSKMRPR